MKSFFFPPTGTKGPELCAYTWPTTSWVSCLISNFVTIRLTVECYIFSREEISGPDLHRQHPITVVTQQRKLLLLLFFLYICINVFPLFYFEKKLTLKEGNVILYQTLFFCLRLTTGNGHFICWKRFQPRLPSVGTITHELGFSVRQATDGPCVIWVS